MIHTYRKAYVSKFIKKIILIFKNLETFNITNKNKTISYLLFCEINNLEILTILLVMVIVIIKKI